MKCLEVISTDVCLLPVLLFVYVCVCVRESQTELERVSFLACPCGSRCVNNTLINMRMNQSAEGLQLHSSIHSPRLSFIKLRHWSQLICSSSTSPDSTALPLSSLVCWVGELVRILGGSIGCEPSGIIFTKCPASARGLTAEPKSTASLSRIMGQCAWFASFPSLLLPVSKMSPGTAREQ